MKRPSGELCSCFPFPGIRRVRPELTNALLLLLLLKQESCVTGARRMGDTRGGQIARRNEEMRDRDSETRNYCSCGGDA